MPPAVVAAAVARCDEITRDRVTNQSLAEQMGRLQKAMEGLELARERDKRMQDTTPKHETWKEPVMGGLELIPCKLGELATSSAIHW